MNNPTTPPDIEYEFTFQREGEQPHTWTLRLDGVTLTRQADQAATPPDWTRLDYHQCEDCPLRSTDSPHCPAAVALADLAQTFGPLISYHEVHVSIQTPQRTVSTRTSAQAAMQSIMGLYLATSGCPTLAKFKPMARFHLPFANVHETLFRVASAYLLAQYRLKQLGQPYEFDLTGLSQLYEKVSAINRALTDRLRGHTQGDANLNALSLLDLYAQEFTFSANENLAEFDHLFQAYTQNP